MKAALPQNCHGIKREQVRREEMLNNLGGDDGIELLTALLRQHFKWVVLHSLVVKRNSGKMLTCNLNTFLNRIRLRLLRTPSVTSRDTGTRCPIPSQAACSH